MGICDHSSRSAFLRSDTDVEQKGLAPSLCSNSLVRTLRWPVKFYHIQLTNLYGHVFMDLVLCTGAQSCWNRKGSSPNCFHKVGSIKLSKNSWYAEAFRVPITGTKGPSPAPEKQPHTIIPPPSNFTLGILQSDKYRSPGNRKTQNCQSDCQMEKRDS